MKLLEVPNNDNTEKTEQAVLRLRLYALFQEAFLADYDPRLHNINNLAMLIESVVDIAVENGEFGKNVLIEKIKKVGLECL